MKLSPSTISIMKNFSAINPSIVFNGTNVLRTVSESKTLMATSEIEEIFPDNVGIYNLSEFLSVLNMFSDPEVDLDPKTRFVRIHEGKRSVKYVFADPRVLPAVPKSITMPDCEVQFKLPQDDLSNIRKASSTLALPHLIISGGPDVPLRLSVSDAEDSSANSYDLEVITDSVFEDHFRFVFSISNFKFAHDDFVVSISSKLISRFEALGSKTYYYVALEKNSTYN